VEIGHTPVAVTPNAKAAGDLDEGIHTWKGQRQQTINDCSAWTKTVLETITAQIKTYFTGMHPASAMFDAGAAAAWRQAIESPDHEGAMRRGAARTLGLRSF
jgi:hypothetical protein